MGIYESINRNQNALGDISGLIGAIRNKNRRQREREGLTAGLTQTRQEETPEYRAAIEAMDSINPMEISINAADRPSPLPSGAPRPSLAEPIPQRYRDVKSLRMPTANDAGWIGELRDLDAGQILDFMLDRKSVV